VQFVRQARVVFRTRIQLKGNKAQWQHHDQQLVLDKLTEARDSLACAKYEKAKEAIEEGISW